MSRRTGDTTIIGFYCVICSEYRLAGPANMNWAKNQIIEHIANYHPDAKTNLLGQPVKDISSQVNTEYLYSPAEVEDFKEWLKELKAGRIRDFRS